MGVTNVTKLPLVFLEIVCAYLRGSKSYLERMGLVMNGVYVLRLSFDEWAGSQVELSNDDVANVCQWLKHLVAVSDRGVLDLATSVSLASLADIVAG